MNFNKVQLTPAVVGAMGKFCQKVLPEVLIDDAISKRGLMNHRFRVEEAQKIALLDMLILLGVLYE